MSVRSDLRAQALEIFPSCWWPNCEPTNNHFGVLELAHIQARGMGHTGYQDRLDNVVMLCRWHHRHFDELEQIDETSRQAFLAKAVAEGALVRQVDSDRYLLTGLATKWNRVQWMDAVASWRRREAGAE